MYALHSSAVSRGKCNERDGAGDGSFGGRERRIEPRVLGHSKVRICAIIAGKPADRSWALSEAEITAVTEASGRG